MIKEEQTECPPIFILKNKNEIKLTIFTMRINPQFHDFQESPVNKKVIKVKNKTKSWITSSKK